MNISHRSNKPFAFRFRSPCVKDASSIRNLISRCPPLDVNSCYAYLLQSIHLQDTCVIVEAGASLAGYVSAYQPPGRPDTLFVWQIAVAAEYRGKGLGSRMVNEILGRPACRKVVRLETTVSPGNDASERLFLNLARQYHASCKVEQLFGNSMFDDPLHAPENLFRIGPLVRECVPATTTIRERAV